MKWKKKILLFDNSTFPKCNWFAFLGQMRYQYRHRVSTWIMLFMGKKNKSLTVKKTLLCWSPLNWYDLYYVIFSKQSLTCKLWKMFLYRNK